MRATRRKPTVAEYPWERWFRKGRVVLRRGRDYECATHGMMQQIRNKAPAHGYSVSITMDPVEDQFACTFTRLPSHHNGRKRNGHAV